MICNTHWDECYPESSMTHLLRMRSDHRPHLRVGHAHRMHLSCNFKYFTRWQHHIDFYRMVQDNWQSGSSSAATISNFTDAANVWNSTVFGYVGAKKRIIMARLRGVQKALERRGRNTTYFHRKANQRKVRNTIQSLQIADGSWCEDESVLREEAGCCFRALFALDGPISESYPFTGCFSQVPPSTMNLLVATPTSSEIRDALSDMSPLKSPGPDELHAEFFQKQWHVVSADIFQAIRNVFQGGDLEQFLNRTSLVLIPKIDVPQSFPDVRPIGLCSVIYKLLTKAIVR
ncbi:hypothetical protein V6N13_012932 [Hibiscus sabdariffa]